VVERDVLQTAMWGKEGKKVKKICASFFSFPSFSRSFSSKHSLQMMTNQFANVSDGGFIEQCVVGKGLGWKRGHFYVRLKINEVFYDLFEDFIKFKR
jgi:hypothetical protein